MNNIDPAILNEQKAARAFSSQAPDFDRLYRNDGIIKYKRQRVYEHVLAHLKTHAHILELNSGTGEDAVFFSEAGHTVHATDISEEMQQQLNEKITRNSLTGQITTELCSYTALEHLKNKGPYDLIFSNFAGLNCTNELPAVFKSFEELLKPGGMVTMVILPQFCIWELLLIFRGKFATATRRFFSKYGRSAKINGMPFTCWYHSPQSVIRQLKKRYSLIGIEGLCTIVPPSYIENFAEKYPKLFSFLSKQENKFKRRWPWKFIGDYYIISFRKNS